LSGFPSQGYLDLADTLATVEHEAALRSAASRAYYGVFHVARDLLAADTEYASALTHREVWDEITKRDRKLGRIGNRCRDNRAKADYEPEVTNVKDLATVTIADAKALKGRLENLRGG